MDIFIKASAGMLVALICYLVLQKQGKDISTLLAIAICTLVAIAALNYITPLIELVDRLEQLGGLNSQMIQILLRSVGIGLIAEIASLICADAGNAAMGKTLQFLGSVVILWLSIPLFNQMIDLIKEILQTI